MVAKKQTWAPSAPEEMRTVSEIAAAARKRKTSVKAGMAERTAAGHGKTNPLTEMQDRIKAQERQIADLMQTNGDIQRHARAVESSLAHEARERRKLTEEVTAIASSLGRCGEGEIVISRMLFGAVRFHGSSSPMTADAPQAETAVPRQWQWVSAEDQKD